MSTFDALASRWLRAICSGANCKGSRSVRAQRDEAARNQEFSPRPCAARAPMLHFRRPGRWPGDAIARARITMFRACRIAIRAPRIRIRVAR